MSAEPDIVCETLRAGDAFVILASDGLWDVAENQTACEVVMKQLAKFKDRPDAAQLASVKLVEHAYAVGSTDNICAIVICFDSASSSVLSVS